MHTIAIDIETKSGYDLLKTGIYKYVESPDFAIILFACKVNTGPVYIYDLYNEELPDNIIKALNDPGYIKTAYNANFERICINKFLNLNVPAEQWDCTMVRSSLLTLPLSLESCSTVLKTELKDKRGKALIKLFGNQMKTPDEKPGEWNNFKEYCVKDVISEQSIRDKVIKFKIPDFERKIWLLDQHINDTGVMVDEKFFNNALKCESLYTDRLLIKAKELTGLDNPNSLPQLKKWIYEETGERVASISKDIKLESMGEKVDAMLDIRKELSRTSVKKYQSMKHGICKDKRVRGMLQYYGANRTGRWAGRLVQLHNLPRNSMSDLDLAHRLLKEGDFEMLEIIFGDVNYVLSQLIRTAFIPAKGCKFNISDFSAIEARVVAWLCNETWRLEVFRTHGKIYEASAAMMFKVPIESVTKRSDLRTRGKIAELALGYGGAVGAIERMGGGALNMTEDQILTLVKKWRKASPNIVKFWYNLNNMVEDTIETRRINKINGLTIYIEQGILFIELPSKRRLAYMQPQVSDNGISYYGINQVNNQWSKIYTYGGKLTENIVQAIARDCLADAMLRLHAKGFKIVMHVHDEIIVETDDKKNYINTIDKIMSEEITWAKGLPLKAETFESYYYKKE